jgi:thioredoxin reductase
MKVRRIVIVGAGPVGLEAALRARHEGHEVTVFESARVGEHVRLYGSVRLFTPFRMSSTELGRERLRASGASLPGDEDNLTAEELRRRYLLPLSRLPELSGAIQEGARVAAIAREGFTKTRSGAGAGDVPRAERPFVLRIVKGRGEAEGLERAEVVIDASGVYQTANATGTGGLPAVGEEFLGDRLERHLPDMAGEARSRYAGKRILLLGDGRSAANAIADLDDLVRAGGDGARTRVEWVHRERGERVLAPVPAAELEQLRVLRELDKRVHRIGREAPWIRRHAGATAAAYRPGPSGAIEVTLTDPRGVERRFEVDRVLALVGYRPDLSLFRELQVHLCYASEGPMALASAILAAQAKDPEASQGCLGQIPHGPDTLKNPEPNFYVLGAKSYGRNPNFLLTLGHRQIEDVLTLIGAAEPRLNLASG